MKKKISFANSDEYGAYLSGLARISTVSAHNT